MSDQLEQFPGQQPVASVAETLWDVVIIGAGPSGTSAAIDLASRGRRVLLVDKERFPREKVCGEGLVADAHRCLKRAGVFDQVVKAGHETKEMQVFSVSGIQFIVPGRYITLRRRILDAVLARRAVECGATFAQAEGRDVSVEGDGTVVTHFLDAPQRIRSRVCILATGAHASLSRRNGPAGARPPIAAAVRCYVRSRWTSDRLTGIYLRAMLPGYAWIFPLGGGEYNVGCAAFGPHGRPGKPDLRRAFDAVMKGHPLLRRLLEEGEIVSPVRGSTLRCGLSPADALRDGRVLSVGEAVACTLPFTGEGVGKAMETGQLAAEVVHEALASGRMDRLEEYPRRLRTEMLPVYRAHALVQGILGAAWANDLVARAIRASRTAENAVACVVAGGRETRVVRRLKAVLWAILR